MKWKRGVGGCFGSRFVHPYKPRTSRSSKRSGLKKETFFFSSVPEKHLEIRVAENTGTRWLLDSSVALSSVSVCKN